MNRVRLRRLLRERDVRGQVDEVVLSVYRDLGVVPKAGRDDNFNKTPGDLSNYKLVLDGDVVVNKMKAWQGSIAVSPLRGIVSGDYLVCEVTGHLDLGYLHHLLRSRPLIGEYARRAQGIRPAQWRLYWDDLADVEVSLPDGRAQRCIADYLDTETARIDALIETKAALIALLRERHRAEITESIFDRDAPSVELKRVSTVLVGFAFPSESFRHDDGGIRLLRGINVGAGSIRWDDTVHLDAAEAQAFSDYALHPRDLVIGMDGTVTSFGTKVAQVGTEDAPALLVQRVARLRPRPDADRDYIRFALQSDQFAAHVTPIVTGISVAHISSEQIGAFRIPLPGLGAQQEIADRLITSEARTVRAASLLERQTALLNEHRQSMITAAVTGELDIPGVAA